MKKNLITITILILFLCAACQKHELKESFDLSKPNSAQPISNSKSKSLYGISMQLGHSGNGCPGCTITDGVPSHTDCQGAGDACSSRAIMEITESGEYNLYFGTVYEPDELTSEDFFFMPDRSLYIIGSNGQYLNIPEQIAYRDEETGAFVFYDIFFSDSQMFVNE